MPSKISRYTQTGWVEVSNLEALDMRLTTIEATGVASSTGFVNSNAKMGARTTPWQTQARFGHKDETGNIHGWLASADGSIEANVAAGKDINVYDHATGLIAEFNKSRVNINGMGIGFSPPYGTAYASLWRAGAEAQGDYGLLLHANETILNVASGGTMSFRRANSNMANFDTGGQLNVSSTVAASGNTQIGNNSIYFYGSGFNGGWYMSDASYIRATNSKHVWLGSGWYGTDGGITLGRGGAAVDGNYRLDCNGNAHIWGSTWSTGDFKGDGMVESTYQVRTTLSKMDNSWTTASYLAYGTAGDGGQQTRIALHSSGAAPQICAIGAYGYIVFHRDEQAGAGGNNPNGASKCWAADHIYPSSLKIKKNIRSLRPERDFLPVELDPFSDTIDAPPDIMSLRPVAYRPLRRETEIVPTDPSGDYSTVNPDDPSSWVSIPRMDFIGDQSAREVLGLIAEEVQHVIPSAVFHGPSKAAEAISYHQITVAMLDHVQRLTDEVSTLRYRITELEGNQ